MKATPQEVYELCRIFAHSAVKAERSNRAKATAKNAATDSEHTNTHHEHCATILRSCFSSNPDVTKAIDGLMGYINQLQVRVELLSLQPDQAYWQPMDTAPKDQEIVVYCPEVHGLPRMVSLCSYHEAAGFCCDELREPLYWMPKPE